ncbi:MAG: hypothetical protein MESAZ_02490 [Saezia sanguinis]
MGLSRAVMLNNAVHTSFHYCDIFETGNDSYRFKHRSKSGALLDNNRGALFNNI